MLNFKKDIFKIGKKRAERLLSKEHPKSIDDWGEWFNNLEGETDVTLWCILHVKMALVIISPKNAQEKTT